MHFGFGIRAGQIEDHMHSFGFVLGIEQRSYGCV